MGLDNSPLDTLKGVGPALREKFAQLGMHTLQDVLFHLPHRYEDRTRITPVARVIPGKAFVIQGQIVSCDVVFGRRRSLLVHLRDHSGELALRFFHFSQRQQKSLSRGSAIRCYGEVRRGANGFEMIHPEYVPADSGPLPDTLTPVYPLTEGISQHRIRAIVAQVLALMEKGKLIEDLLPDCPVGPGINEAIMLLHHPPPGIDLEALLSGGHPAQQRLAFEELLAHQSALRLARQQLNRLSAPSFEPPGDLYNALLGSFGFELTAAQKRVAAEVARDLSGSTPALRLIQGDVGSGKTAIAAIAAAHAVENGYQCAIMAPTGILAEQHFENLSAWLAPLGIGTAWLTGMVKGARRKSELSRIADGEAMIIIGTHALFQEEVTFSNLGLVVIDEQHRFGVHQRLALRAKGSGVPHQLVMTATPIPRTLTMSLYADMDCSVIDELPPGRTPVTTTVLPDSRRADVIDRVRAACQSGKQAYWVCTLIEESEAIQSQAAEDTAALLSEELSGLTIGLVHGRLSTTEKTRVMTAFKAKQIDLLVATTVIEVGVDVANASLMVIENSERLGLAQLHQLRGRIGRGSDRGHCVLLYQPPLGRSGKARLNIMRETSDGFLIAEKDLEIRGPGEIFGSRQSGSLQFRIADIVRDHHLLPAVSGIARRLVKEDRETALALSARWMTSPESYSQV